MAQSASSNWTSFTIKEHLKYLDNVKTKCPNNIKIAKLYWQEQLEKITKNEQRHNSQSTKSNIVFTANR